MSAPRCRLGERIDSLANHWDVLKPDGDGPFPVVIQLHGCGGKKPFQLTWAKAAVEAGAAAIVVDSHAPRRISQLSAYATVCTGMRLPGRERAGDLFAAMAWARRQPWCDSTRIAAAGWSHGAWTISDALFLRDQAEMARATGIDNVEGEPLNGLKGAFLVYPYLGIGVLNRPAWRLKPKTVAIIGGKDGIAGGVAPRKLLRRQADHGCPMQIIDFETATHAFDEPEARDIRVRYDPALTKRAHGLYQDFLRAL